MTSNPLKVLLMPGSLDERVNSSHARVMSEKLTTDGYEHELLIFENDDHILRNNKQQKDFAIASWLTEKLILY